MCLLHLFLLCGHFLTFQSFQSMLHHFDIFDACGNSCLISMLPLFIYSPCLWIVFWTMYSLVESPCQPFSSPCSLQLKPLPPMETSRWEKAEDIKACFTFTTSSRDDAQSSKSFCKETILKLGRAARLLHRKFAGIQLSLAFALV